jgi:hypothetical protein
MYGMLGSRIDGDQQYGDPVGPSTTRVTVSADNHGVLLDAPREHYHSWVLVYTVIASIHIQFITSLALPLST